MNERVKEVRKVLGLTQRNFGRRLGVSDTAISKIEKGENGLTDQMFLSICQTYCVNPDWLRTGEGGDALMFDEGDPDIIAISKTWELDELSQSILEAYVKASPKRRKAINGFIREIASAAMSEHIQAARENVREAIFNARVPNPVKEKIVDVATVAFDTSFPYYGSGNVDDDELATYRQSPEEYADELANMARQQALSEKKRESQIYSAQESALG